VDLSCWVEVVFLGFWNFVFFCCCGTYFYIQALKGGRALLKNWVWVGVEMATETKVFQFSEVQTHGSPTDCWLIIHGKVYDVTKFLEHHPGGDDVLLSATGKDATNDFEDVGHSVDAHNLMKDFEIGEVDIASTPEEITYKPATSPEYNHDKSSAFIIKILQFLGPIVVLALALTLRYLYKKNNNVE
jgi:cytochrome b involved in lipid metabolism